MKKFKYAGMNMLPFTMENDVNVMYFGVQTMKQWDHFWWNEWNKLNTELKTKKPNTTCMVSKRGPNRIKPKKRK